MRSLMLIALVTCIAAVDDGVKLELDDWKFDWSICEVGKDLKFGAMKTPEKSKLYLRAGIDFVEFDEMSGEKLSQAIGRFEEFRKVVEEDQTKEIVCGDAKVIFRNSKKHGFYAGITENERFATSTILIDAKQAKALVAPLGRSRRIVALLKDRVNP